MSKNSTKKKIIESATIIGSTAIATLLATLFFPVLLPVAPVIGLAFGASMAKNASESIIRDNPKTPNKMIDPNNQKLQINSPKPKPTQNPNQPNPKTKNLSCLKKTHPKNL